MSQGLYLYCVIDTGDARNFGPIGIGDRRDPVTTIAYRDLGAVVSTVPMDRYAVGRETMLGHERVIEKVMVDHTVLPARFYTVAPGAEEVRNLLRSGYSEFKALFRRLDNKVELGLKALWRDMDQVLTEAAEEASHLLSHRAPPTREEFIQQTRAALERTKAQVAELLMQPLRTLAVDLRLHRTYGDDMILNAAFLVDRTREREFDARLEHLAARCSDSIELKYVGPAPPYSFVTLVIRHKSQPGPTPRGGGIQE
ncbi:MAG: GvpL/GvpF family gas vesicle protein [Deltaproteobacteria bacterium]|nr:GvpL/GvpF family gas vesicle protein [Deltaproteobacteria bacterium]